MSGNLFVVISNHNPQIGKRERISKVRAHITQRHFLKLRNEAGNKQRQQGDLSFTGTQAYDASKVLIPKELPNLIPASHALLNPTVLELETTRRMHKCKPPRSLCSSEIGNCPKQALTQWFLMSSLITWFIAVLLCLASGTVFSSCSSKYIVLPDVLPDLWNGFRLVHYSQSYFIKVADSDVLLKFLMSTFVEVWMAPRSSRTQSAGPFLTHTL